MSDNNDFGAFFMGFVVGALTGAVVSLLMAPQSGEETRQVIKEKAIELRDKGYETYEETKHKADHVYHEAINKATELTEVTKQKAEELKQKGQVVLEEQKEKVVEALKPKKGQEPATEV